MSIHSPRDGATLRTETYESSFEVDRCPDCAGVWLDKGELDGILRKAENDWSRDLAKPGNLVGKAFSAARAHHEPIGCPKCGGTLENKEYAYASQVFVDICPKGCGMWLDAGELAALERFYERHHDRSQELGFKDTPGKTLPSPAGRSRPRTARLVGHIPTGMLPPRQRPTTSASRPSTRAWLSVLGPSLDGVSKDLWARLASAIRESREG